MVTLHYIITRVSYCFLYYTSIHTLLYQYTYITTRITYQHAIMFHQVWLSHHLISYHLLPLLPLLPLLMLPLLTVYIHYYTFQLLISYHLLPLRSPLALQVQRYLLLRSTSLYPTPNNHNLHITIPTTPSITIPTITTTYNYF